MYLPNKSDGFNFIDEVGSDLHSPFEIGLKVQDIVNPLII